ncbi:MAG TPA: homocysteine S-methyltransferase family protein, partial [Candidatus Hydrogenedentes bacterium]|nr:homocysteine S-methyltransferase family protein [Candidatus Hydrogenedentota bacterium]
MDFSAMLRERLILLDGAMGTLIQGLDLGDADFGGADYRMLSDMLVFSRPEAVRDIHLAYYRAGAHAVETNTFGASPFRLSEYDFRAIDTSRFAPLPHDIDLPAMSHEDWAYWLSRRGAELACEAREIHRRDP